VGSANLVGKVADRAKGVVSGKLAERAHRSAEDFGLLARTLRLAGQQLKDNMAAPYVGKVADQVDRFSKYIEHADARQLLRRAASVSEAKPLLFLGGAIALGFAGGRFLKSSQGGGANGSERRQTASKDRERRSQNTKRRRPDSRHQSLGPGITP